MWTTGKLDGYDYQIKHFSEGSVYGINKGRISKIQISKEERILVNYDRGWDVEPMDLSAKAVYEKLLEAYN